ncbi:acetylserotonin O-methyltransferase [Limnohabitans sp. B9-3]|uniref:acetylserotonin O-methyltransferase n=1 Tax=Limnohabitans sp. B9-3 TaxID=1100707 RepID=UPI001E65432E|nr:acetylserotonin O-methyltransferase [Limnohabitans sp. B9-3]
MNAARLPDALNEVTSWHDQVLQWLERIYASPSLYKWSLSNPVTRWITKRRTQQIFDLMSGFVYSQVLLGCVRLDLFRMLQLRPLDLQQISLKTKLPEEALQRLLLSAVSVGLLEYRSRQRFGLGALGVPMAIHPGIGAMVEHNHLLYQDMQDPLAFLNNAWRGGMAEYWPYAHDAQAAERVAQDKFSRYSDLMASSQEFVVQEILGAYFFDEHRCVLDVGAGKGRFASELALHAKHLDLKLFDLPPVLELAKATFESKGLLDRLSLCPGNFLHDALPQGADLVTLVRVAHDHPDDVVQQLLRKIYEALPVGGTLLLAEPMARTYSQSADGPTQTDAYFHFYLLAMGAGRLRTPEALMLMMSEAGFARVELVPNNMPIHAQILLGRKSKCLP